MACSGVEENSLPDCIFCRIGRREKSEGVRYEDDEVIAFDDHNPRAPVHILIAAKKHVGSLSELENVELALCILHAAQLLIRRYALDSEGYTFGFHGGGRQSINHLHAQLLAGMGDTFVL